MKFVYPDIEKVFDTNCEGRINTIIIENPDLLYNLILDLNNQLVGKDGKAVLSKDNIPIEISKNLELIDRFIPFELNTKALMTRITNDLEKKALSDENYAETVKLIGMIDSYLTGLTFDSLCDIAFSKVKIESVIKSAGVYICDEYDSLCERIIDYFELVNEYIGDKLFITLNMRSLLNDREAGLFLETVLAHNYNVIMIENKEYTLLPLEKRAIIDNDKCVIC